MTISQRWYRRLIDPKDSFSSSPDTGRSKEKENKGRRGTGHFLYSVNQSKFIQFPRLYLGNLSDASRGKRDKPEQ